MYDAIHTAVAVRAVQVVGWYQKTGTHHWTPSIETSQAWMTEAVRAEVIVHAKYTLRFQESLYQADGEVSESALLFPGYDCDYVVQ